MFQKKKTFKLRHFILILFFFLLVLLFWGRNFFSETTVFKKVLQFNLWTAKPAFFLKNQAVSFGQNIKGYFQSKKSLNVSNQFLKEENLKLSARAMRADILEKENSELLNFLGRKQETDFLIAAILFRPPMSDFDTFVIDSGAKEGIQKGMKVTAYGDLILGEISEVFENSGKVRLFSYDGVWTDVLFQKTNLSAAALGRGGENFEITLAKDVIIELGDKILTTDLQPLILGEVQKIIKNESEPFQKIYFRYPLNLNELRYVYILK